MFNLTKQFFKALVYPDKTVFRLRILVGIIAFLLPISLITLSCLLGLKLQPSISHYNFTNFREIFTGSLMAIVFFMLCYKVSNREKKSMSRTNLINFSWIFCNFSCVISYHTCKHY